MGNSTITPGDIVWQTPHYVMDASDGEYAVRCSLEMEPPIQDPVYDEPERRVRVKNGWIDLNDAAAAVAEAVNQVGGNYDTIVGVALVQNTL